MESYIKMFKNYANFNGRTSRKDYWMAVLVNFALVMVLAIIGAALNTRIISTIICLYSLAMIIPSFSISIRRMHDIGKSGFWILITYVPVVGGIWYLILTCTAGSVDQNEYGMPEL